MIQHVSKSNAKVNTQTWYKYYVFAALLTTFGADFHRGNSQHQNQLNNFPFFLHQIFYAIYFLPQ